jgi:serine/threonine protein kinase
MQNVLVGAEGEPYLIDLGSVREANVKIETRRDVSASTTLLLLAPIDFYFKHTQRASAKDLCAFPECVPSQELRVAEQAAQHCTASYRAPELYDPPRGVTLDARYGMLCHCCLSSLSHAHPPTLCSRCRTDVWSLGCLLFAMWFGYSPFECEFSGDALRVVECSSLRVLSAVPRPASPSRADRAVLGLAGWILEKDLGRRPYTSDVITRIDEALRGLRDGDNVV